MAKSNTPQHNDIIFYTTPTGEVMIVNGNSPNFSTNAVGPIAAYIHEILTTLKIVTNETRTPLKHHSI